MAWNTLKKKIAKLKIGNRSTFFENAELQIWSWKCKTKKRNKSYFQMVPISKGGHSNITSLT